VLSYFLFICPLLHLLVHVFAIQFHKDCKITGSSGS
jgi:hypothetical protein